MADIVLEGDKNGFGESYVTEKKKRIKVTLFTIQTATNKLTKNDG